MSDYTNKNIKHCPGCQAELDIKEKKCPYCSASQYSKFEICAHRFFESALPKSYPATKVLMAINIVLFIVVAVDILLQADFGISDALMTPPGEIIYRWGAHLRGEFVWWRLITANFIHIGIIHIIFNMSALRFVGPYVERTFGGAITIASYIFLGALSMFASNVMGGQGLVAGASGAIMAYIGMAGVAAHREHTPLSLKVRNSMISAAVATVAFGLIVNGSIGHGIDNIAHCAGLILGGVFGFILPRKSCTGYTNITIERVARILAFVALSLGIAAFTNMGMVGASIKDQNECIRFMKMKKYDVALNYCKSAYEKDKSRVISYHNYILINVIKNKQDEAKRLCDEADIRFKETRESEGKLSFDALCHEIRK